MFENIDVDTIAAILMAIATAISTIVAAWQNRKKNAAVETVQAVKEFYDPRVSDVQVSPTVVNELDGVTFKMSEETRRAVLGQITDPDAIASINAQIADAEAMNSRDYWISIPGGGSYHIQFGLIGGGAYGMKPWTSEIVGSTSRKG